MVANLWRDILRWILSQLVSLLPARLACRLLAWPFERARRQVQDALTAPPSRRIETLVKIVEANRRTEFGQVHAFDQIHDQQTFVTKVPQRSYAELEPYIQRHLRGESEVLVSGPIIGFATGGAGDPAGPFPLTAAGLAPWETSEQLLLREAIKICPRVMNGQGLHILPFHEEEESRAAVPVLPADVLIAAGRRRSVWCGVPRQLFSVFDETLRFYLILRLTLGRPLTMLRASCPGTLTILAEHLELQGPRLIEDLARGGMDGLEGLDPAIREAIPSRRADPPLAKRLEQALNREGRLTPEAVWPGLKVLICSCAGPARRAAIRLADRFGDLPLLDPGHRTAAAIVTLPWARGGGAPMLLGQHLEFRPLGSENRATITVDDLEVGSQYQPVITNASGLYRFQIDDRMEVLPKRGGLPRLIFAGRGPRHLPLDGGRLAEAQLNSAVAVAVRRCDVVLTGYSTSLEVGSEDGGRREEGAGERGTKEGGLAGRPGAEEDRAGWLSRILRRRKVSRARAALPALDLIIEPAAKLGGEAGRKLRDTVDEELRQCCPAYEQLRGADRLGPPRMLILKHGALGRINRRRLAGGLAGAHDGVPTIGGGAWISSREEIDARL